MTLEYLRSIVPIFILAKVMELVRATLIKLFVGLKTRSLKVECLACLVEKHY